ncbi:MAG: pectate lyase [Paludibacteraceae bacterium]|nr:pectate lyase [Paludibacteraceae bacterium]
MDIRLLYLVLGISLCLASCKSGGEDDPKPASQVLAFPGADGGGKYTTGGREGMVVHVTSLEDDINDRGSLRYALSLAGARTIVFDVSGTINLKRQLEISEGTVTIAGQTAPGDGICIAGFPVVIKTSNVIIRFLRFRMGDQNKVEGDALTINDRRNIIIDHCSFSWSTDECVSVYGNTNFTLQYCFITESLRQSVHIKGNHGYGGIWGGTNASFHHNLLAHHDSRNPRFDHDYVNSRCAGPIDYVNNVIYNWGGNSAYGGEGTNKGAGGRHINMVNNYYKYGPATSKKYRIVNPTTKCGDNCGKSPGGTVEPGKFYITGNYVDGSSAVTKDNWQGVDPDEVSKLSQCKATARWTDGLTTLDNEQTAEAAFETVLAKAGCSLHRDAVDLRIVQEVKNRGGKLVNSPDEAGGYPTLASKTAPADTDHDGMPDEWEDANGLDKNNLSDGKICTLDDKYTNLEVYLNSLVQDLF